MAETPSCISGRVAEFFALLREEHGFSIGQREVHDALRALELLGISQRSRTRAALRAIACCSPEQIVIFDKAYDDIFLAAEDGVAQAANAARHSRPGPTSQGEAEQPAPRRRDAHENEEPEEGGTGNARERRIAEQRNNEELESWLTLRARYSAAAAPAEPPSIATNGLDEMQAAARNLLRSVHLGRASRRCCPASRRDE